MTDRTLYVPGLYELRDGVPDLGISPGHFLSVDPSDENPYVVTRIVSRRFAEMVLSSPGVRLVSTEGASLRLV